MAHLVERVMLGRPGSSSDHLSDVVPLSLTLSLYPIKQRQKPSFVPVMWLLHLPCSEKNKKVRETHILGLMWAVGDCESADALLILFYWTDILLPPMRAQSTDLRALSVPLHIVNMHQSVRAFYFLVSSNQEWVVVILIDINNHVTIVPE